MEWFEYPITSTYQDHINSNRTAGVDYGTPINIPIITLFAGTVSNFTDEHGGRYVDIEWGDTKWRFLHLNEFVKNSGDIVKIEDVIGISGNTGWSTGAHTHVEVQKKQGSDWVRVNPMPYIQEGINNLSITSTVMRDWFVQGREDLANALKNDNDVKVWLMGLEYNYMQVIDKLYRIKRSDVCKAIRDAEITLYDWLSNFGGKEIPGGIWSLPEVSLYSGNNNCTELEQKMYEIEEIIKR